MITRRDFLVAAAALSVYHPRWAIVRPADVLLMRHAEKDERHPDVHLDAQGQARAAALVKLFPAKFTTPDIIFASRASKVSNHAVETVTPLAKALHLPIDDSFRDNQYAALATAILSRPAHANRHILVCWHHETLPQLASALEATPPIKWPATEYDHVWQIQYTLHGVVFADLHERLLPDDRWPLVRSPW
jgi:broad specificity phosphatase PhoE